MFIKHLTKVQQAQRRNQLFNTILAIPEVQKLIFLNPAVRNGYKLGLWVLMRVCHAWATMLRPLAMARMDHFTLPYYRSHLPFTLERLSGVVKYGHLVRECIVGIDTLAEALVLNGNCNRLIKLQLKMPQVKEEHMVSLLAQNLVLKTNNSIDHTNNTLTRIGGSLHPDGGAYGQCLQEFFLLGEKDKATWVMPSPLVQDAVGSGPFLRRLGLSGIVLSDNALEHCLKIFPNVEDLSIRGCFYNCTDPIGTLDSSTTQKIKSITLGFINKFSDSKVVEKTIPMASVIGQCSAVSCLDLYWNDTTREVLTGLVDVFEQDKLPLLKDLEFHEGYNTFHENDIIPLIQALKAPLSFLTISGAPFGSMGARALALNSAVRFTLKELTISGRHVDVSSTATQLLLANLPSLEIAHFGSLPLRPQSMKHLNWACLGIKSLNLCVNVDQGYDADEYEQELADRLIKQANLVDGTGNSTLASVLDDAALGGKPEHQFLPVFKQLALLTKLETVQLALEFELPEASDTESGDDSDGSHLSVESSNFGRMNTWSVKKRYYRSRIPSHHLQVLDGCLPKLKKLDVGFGRGSLAMHRENVAWCRDQWPNAEVVDDSWRPDY